MSDAQDYSTTLAAYIAARDQVLSSITAGKPILEMEIRNRRVKYSDPFDLLKEIESQIDKYQKLVDGDAQSSNGGSVNRVRIKRRQL